MFECICIFLYIFIFFIDTIIDHCVTERVMGNYKSIFIITHYETIVAIVCIVFTCEKYLKLGLLKKYFLPKYSQ